MSDLFQPFQNADFSIVYENNGSGVVIETGETLSLETILSLHQHVYHPERLTRLGYAIFDMRKTCYVNVQMNELEVIAQRDAQAHQINPHFVVAIIPCPDFSALQRNLFEVFSIAYADTLRKQLFSDFSIAHQWAIECWHEEQTTRLNLATLKALLPA